MDRVSSIKEIRAKLGCDLREAADLYENHRADWQEHVQKILVSKRPWTSPQELVRDQIRGYYAALDNGEPEDMAMRKAFSKIQIALGMHWTPKDGTVTTFCRHCHCNIKQFSQQWYSIPETVLPQYCWVDPAGGSQLHEPTFATKE